jgi:cellulose synthase/poly-beta-1,6-N-acetylglucosamine synthase-like glycosyltransferase
MPPAVAPPSAPPGWPQAPPTPAPPVGAPPPPASGLDWPQAPATAPGWPQVPATAPGWPQVPATAPGWPQTPATAPGWPQVPVVSPPSAPPPIVRPPAPQRRLRPSRRGQPSVGDPDWQPPTWDERPQRPSLAWWRGWLGVLDKANTRRALQHMLVVLGLIPLLAILARSVPYLGQSKLLLAYGMAVLGSTIALIYIAYTRYQDPAEGARLPATLPLVSCLVAVKDDVDVIARCVASMVGQDYPRLEVIVIDDESTDGTRELLTSLAEDQPILVLALDRNVGKKAALVRGVEYANGEIIVFTDSDCVLAPDAVSRCVAAFAAQPDLGGLSGHSRALNANDNLLTRVQDVWYEGQFRIAKAAESAFKSVTCISGPLAAFRREAIFNYLPAWANDTFLGRPFRFSTDRQLTGYVLGQRWAGRKLKRRFADSPFVTSVDYPERHWRVEYSRSARVWTNVPAGGKAFMRQQIRWKKSFLRNLCFTGSFMWRRGKGPALLYYSHALWVIMAPFMAVRHLVWLPARGLWLLTLLYLCGVALKGGVWALCYRVENPGCPRWVYRPLMSLVSSLALSWLLPWSTLTIGKSVWARGTR